MYYDFSFIIHKEKTKSNPEVKVLKLTYGVVHRLSTFWWPGPHGLVHLVIRHHEHQVIPTNRSGSLHYDNYTHVMDERIELFSEPYTLKLVGWGVGLKYDHEVIVGVGILPPECFPEYAPEDTRWTKLFKLIGIK